MATNFYARIGKRWFDTLVALAGLLILAPLLFLVALAVRLTSRGPAFFRQERIGQFGKPFRIFKFRTMRLDASGVWSPLTASGDSRITPLGKLLRKTKMDELPQLINILMADMSLVGPRPEVAAYTVKYTERQKGVLRAKPGITGLCAVAYVDEEELLASHADKESFYLETVLPAKLELDIAYCEEIRFAKDLKLILTTLTKVLSSICTAYRAPRASFSKHYETLD